MTSLREHFTIHALREPGCVQEVDEVNDGLLPTSIKITISGYNYQTVPVIFRDGNKIMPLNFSYDYSNMVYYYTLAAPQGSFKHQWIVETYDFVEPAVHDQMTGREFEVLPLRRRLGYNKWLVRIN